LINIPIMSLSIGLMALACWLTGCR